ncbi:MAG: replicative DNA helicase [Actinomycetota bacterium]
MSDAPRPVTPTRVPPSNLRAEESVLGAMLLSREAIAEVVETIDPDHFYKPAHGHLYDAIMGLYGAGQPVDVVTVAEELQRANLLEEIGGPALLLDLQASTPAISNAAHYAKIVEEHALLRRLITVSNEIAEMAYGVPDDVIKAIDEAEARMFEVAQRRVTNTTAQIKDLLSANLDRLEMLYERGEAITGTSTGYLDLDELLAGLQPNALYVVGARPAMGKALALDTPLPTPTGWTTMGGVAVGDEVIDERGSPTTVTYKSPIHVDHECYEVTFDDGSIIVADAEHQWLTYDDRAWTSRRERWHRAQRDPTSRPELDRDQSDRSAEPATRTTRELAATVRIGRDRRPNHNVPVAEALDLPEVELPLDPYLLGCWLGDGHTGEPRITTMDGELVDAFVADGWELEPTPHQRSGRAGTYAIRSPRDADPDPEHHTGGRRLSQFARRLRACGLWEPPRSTDPVHQHIPSTYLRAGFKQRLALLQGLMDTDGCVVDGQTTCQLSLPNHRLVSDARELVLSLGMKAGQLRREVSNAGTHVWTLDFWPPEPVFRLARNVEAQTVVDRPHSRTRWRTIVDVRQVKTVPVQCITVDSPNHLYLAGREMIPTHNTAFALGMTANAAMADQKPVLFFSLEMSQLELSQRILCSEALVDSSRVKTGRIEEPEWNRISHAVGRLAEAPIYIDDNPHTSVMEIRAKARRLKSRVGDLGLVVVDYIQLMTGRANAESRQVEVSEISRNLKILARELEAPVVALAQLNRQLEQRVDKRPMLSDLRESGSLEQDADVVMFLYRDEVYDDQSPDRGVAEVIVAKHRNGPTGKAKLAFRGQYTRFDNMARSVPSGPPADGSGSGSPPPPEDF